MCRHVQIWWYRYKTSEQQNIITYSYILAYCLISNHERYIDIYIYYSIVYIYIFFINTSRKIYIVYIGLLSYLESRKIDRYIDIYIYFYFIHHHRRSQEEKHYSEHIRIYIDRYQERYIYIYIYIYSVFDIYIYIFIS